MAHIKVNLSSGWGLVTPVESMILTAEPARWDTKINYGIIVNGKSYSITAKEYRRLEKILTNRR